MFRIVITLGLCIPLFAQQQSPPEKTARLEGQIANEKTGEPIRRAKVTLRPANTPGSGGYVGVPGSEAGVYVAHSDAEGKFQIDSIDPGAFRLTAERQGFLSGSYGARGRSMFGAILQLSANQEIKGLSIKLTPQAVLTGRVLDEEGEPFARATVQALSRRYFRGKFTMLPVSSAVTSDTGEFRLADLRPGRYILSVLPLDRSAMMGDAPARNTSGRPEEQYITTYYPSALEEKDARQVDVEAGHQVPGLDVTLRKTAVYRVRGNLTGFSGMPRTVRLMAMPADGHMIGPMSNSPSILKDDWSFEISGLKPGAYTITAIPMQKAGSGGQTRVEVGRENVENVVIANTPPASIAVTVRLEGGIEKWEQSSGKKWAMTSLRVNLWSTEAIMSAASGGTVKEDGTLTINSSLGGKARAIVSPLPQGIYLKSILAGDQELIDSGIDFANSPPSRLEFVLAAGTGEASGVVRDAKEQPSVGAVVTLIPRSASPERLDLNRTTTTNQTGNFTLPNLPPGDYDLIAWEEVEPGAHLDPEYVKPHDSYKKRIEIKPNGQTQVQLAAVPAGAAKIP